MYTLQEFSQLTGIKIRTLRSWIVKGQLKARKVANENGWERWYVNASEIDRIEQKKRKKAELKKLKSEVETLRSELKDGNEN